MTGSHVSVFAFSLSSTRQISQIEVQMSAKLTIFRRE